MDQTKKMARLQYLILITLCVALAAIFVTSVFSIQNINPGNVDWVVNGGGDYLQHYLGWSFFRHSPWIPNFLFFQNLNYPEGTSVIVTDSNPLFCLLFKPFSAFLPADFQFNGLWVLCSYLLAAVFSFLCAWKLTKSRILSLTAVMLVIFNPVILQRALIHDTLTSHWLIIIGFWLAINYDRKWNAPGWAALTILTMLIHVYFLPMIGFVLMLQLIWMIISRSRWFNFVLVIAAFVMAFALSYFLFGYDHILAQSGSYGELSMNLNAFINPDGTSSLLFDRDTFPLQYEGYNYWGLGLLTLFVLGVFANDRAGWKVCALFILPCLLYLLLAVSNNISFDKNILLSVALPEKLQNSLSVFRSSGRLAWPFYYLAVFVSLKSISRFLNSCRKPAIGPVLIMGLIIIIQFIDLSGFFTSCHLRFSNPENTLPELADPFWQDEGKEFSHLYVSEGDSKNMDMFALYAARNGMTFNRSANARSIQRIFARERVILEDLTPTDLEASSLYVILEGNKFDELLSACQGKTKLIDGFSVIVNR